MQKNWVAIFVVILALAGGGFYALKTNLLGNAANVPPLGGGDGVVCTMEAKLCPDGVTYVGRQGPKCEFAACPTATAATSTIEISLNQTVVSGGVAITPLEVIEDSRCPAGVYCIQAGTVRVKARVMGGMGTSTMTFTLGKEATTEAETITLTKVSPLKTASHQISPSEYRFTFEIAKRN